MLMNHLLGRNFSALDDDCKVNRTFPSSKSQRFFWVPGKLKERTVKTFFGEANFAISKTLSVFLQRFKAQSSKFM